MKKAKAFAVCGILSLTLAAAGLAGCGGSVDGTATALVINGEEVNTGTANFILRYEQAETMYMMTSYGLASAGSMWDSPTSSGVTYGSQFKDSTKESIAEMVLLRQHASEYNVTISDDEKAKIDSAAQSVVDGNGDALKRIGATKEDVADALELYTYKIKMKAPMVEDTDREVSDEEAAQTRITYARIALTQSDDSGNVSDVSDEEKASRKEKCEEVLKQVQESEDPATADISTIAKAVDENFVSTGYNYGSDDTAIDDAVKEVVKNLSDGEVYDGVIEGENTYYIVRLDKMFDEDATETKKKSIISDRENENYNNKVQEWKDAITVDEKTPWKDLTVTDKDSYTVKAEDTSSGSSSTSSGSSSGSSSTSSSSSGSSSTSGSTSADSSSSAGSSSSAS